MWQNEQRLEGDNYIKHPAVVNVTSLALVTTFLMIEKMYYVVFSGIWLSWQRHLFNINDNWHWLHFAR